jgi:hypothetical protein
VSAQLLERPTQHSHESVVVLSELPEDVHTYIEADRLQAKAQQIGAVALEGVAEFQSASRFPNLYEAAKAAAEGDPDAIKFVKANIRADVVERTIKAGIVMTTELDQDVDGKLIQYGQTLEDVQVNSLAFASGGIMGERVAAEARNAIRLQRCLDQGLLKEYYFVVFSRYTDSTNKHAAKNAGFFVDTMTTSIQATTEKDGVVIMESSYLAGVKQPGADRHDIEAVVGVGKEMGVDFTGKNDAESIDMGVLVPKHMMPNGVIDIDKMFDDHAGGTFMGQDKPRRDYVEFRKECDAIVANFEPKVEEICAEFLASIGCMNEPLDATDMLHNLSERHMVEYAVGNKDINPLVFGVESAAHIMEARRQVDLGNYEQAAALMDRAKETADSSSCPTGSSVDKSSNRDNKDGEVSGKKWVGCGVCGTKRAFFGDPCATSMTCRECKSSATNGRVVDRRKETEQAKAAEKTTKAQESQKKNEAKELINEPQKDSFNIPVGTQPNAVQQAAPTRL